jgi:adenine-specific DNA-methyltransferase
MVELIWDGKYDAQGRRVAPLRLKLPFQTVETVNESAELRQRSLFSAGRASDWRNRLIWGDKKYVLPALLDEFAGQVDLIYIDPPFFTGTDQIYTIPIDGADRFLLKEPSLIEEAAYRNVWRNGSDSLCAWIYDTLYFLRELLSNKGAIFIRFDQYWSHYVKVIADEVFGKQNFQNDIALKRIYKNLTNQGKRSLQIGTDSLFLYFRSEAGRFYDIEQVLEEERPGYWRKMDDSSGVRNPPERLIFGQTFFPPAGKHFKFSQEKIDSMVEAGKIRLNERGRPEYWVEPTDRKPFTSNWTDISSYSFTTGYPTENSEILLERVIKLCSLPNDLVLDCFAGSGTTAAVAERLGRRWITSDIGRFAIHTTRKRLLRIPDVRPFVVQNLGKYERQAWQAAEFGGPERAAEVVGQYRRFILDLYGARPIQGYAWLHGLKGGRMVHVGPVDSPISPGDVTQIAIEFRKAVGSGADAPAQAAVDVLGWDFAFELNEVARQQAQQANIAMRFVRIPREVLEQKAVEQGDIRFFELAALAIDVETFRRNVSTAGEGEGKETGRRPVSTADVTLKLTDFVIPPDDVPEDVQRAISHWSQWIDYWAVDWDNQGDTFHNMWQTYRTRAKKKGAAEPLQLQTTHRYEQPGEYTIMVKVIDILGNDTTKTVKVTVL